MSKETSAGTAALKITTTLVASRSGTITAVRGTASVSLPCPRKAEGRGTRLVQARGRPAEAAPVGGWARCRVRAEGPGGAGRPARVDRTGAGPDRRVDGDAAWHLPRLSRHGGFGAVV